VDSAEQLSQAVRQAEQAIDLGLRLGRTGQPVRYDQLGIYRLLCTIGDMQHLMGFARDVLGPLVDYDTAHRTELVRTLSVYLHQHGSHKQSARILHLHTNTVAYRIARIETITGLDLNDPDDRLIAHVAVKIIKSQGG
jgi:DNA-binding PucR family transcriptional regulator